ncbi:unnamed protein product [Spirodela intermedia]|uniref:Uncharacterized protein n=1 Tax=Spirodela intermedia TaxID=51605 RepID=A0A7I8IFY5_SPIIN|nr:unnamed protein product [Spirodela intermedia]CAA6656551.1 unnamed protein product [Spirodela intermedia]
MAASAAGAAAPPSALGGGAPPATAALPPPRRRLRSLHPTGAPGFEPLPKPYETPPQPSSTSSRVAGRRPSPRAAPWRRRRAAAGAPGPADRVEAHEGDQQRAPKGWVIADFLDKLESLMGRGQYGSTALLAKVGGIVAERAREEAAVLVAGGEVDERKVTELERVLKLMEMDLEMVKAAVKEETLRERVEVARARCRQAILVAMSL